MSPRDVPLLRAGLAVALFVAVVGVGAMAFLPDHSRAEQRIGHDASARLASLDSFSATVETTIERGTDVNRSTRRVSVRPNAGQRRSVHVAGNATSTDLFVSNGSVLWLYDESEQTATRLQSSQPRSDTSLQGQRIQRLFNRLNVSRSSVEDRQTAPPDPGVSPLPVVPNSRATPVPSATDTARFGVRYNGTASVDGRETYVLSVESTGQNASGTLSNYTQTMYVDTEWFLPLKTETTFSLRGERVRTTTVYHNVSFNPSLDDSLFQFDPPDNATIETLDTPSVARYDSLGALRANASTSLPVPDTPSTFEFDRGTITSGNFSSLSLQYSNATARILVSKTTGTAANGTNSTAADGERVTVGGRTATYRRVATTAVLSWHCETHRYTVTGTGVSRDLLFQIAASIDCG